MPTYMEINARHDLLRNTKDTSKRLTVNTVESKTSHLINLVASVPLCKICLSYKNMKNITYGKLARTHTFTYNK